MSTAAILSRLRTWFRMGRPTRYGVRYDRGRFERLGFTSRDEAFRLAQELGGIVFDYEPVDVRFYAGSGAPHQTGNVSPGAEVAS